MIAGRTYLMTGTKYILDNEGAEIMRLSNDAFLYLTQEEEPLDENNLIEARQLYVDFPLGFEITKWQYVENGEVEVTIVTFIDATMLEPKLIKPKSAKQKTVKKKRQIADIKTGPSMSLEDLTADFFKAIVLKTYVARPRPLSECDLLWLKNVVSWAQANRRIDVEELATQILNG